MFIRSRVTDFDMMTRYVGFCRDGRSNLKFERGTILLSASDLMRFANCHHATALDHAYANGADLVPAADSEEAALLQGQGDAHEAAYLAKLRESGSAIVEIKTKGVSLKNAAHQTRSALSDGPDYVFQGALMSMPWGGYSDFLERVDRPSELGNFSYEVIDTKLKRKADPKHVLQLSLYSDLLAEVQGVSPDHAHLVLGTGERVSLRLNEYSAYARQVRSRLEEFVANVPHTLPEPVAACGLCRWREKCGAEWEATDSLTLVAGIARTHRRKLESAGVTSMSGLAERTERVPKITRPVLDRLRIQARLQTERRNGGSPGFKLREFEPGRGFSRLPPPDDGDLFYDIEGDPFLDEGLEYLHGVWKIDDGNGVFRDFWAHDRDQERQATIDLLDFFTERLRRYPSAHIYHYAPYEITALRRLVSRHGVKEEALDQLLREERFVDLFRVVSGALIASEPSYSLKDLEAFYMEGRSGNVVSAGASIVAYEKWRDTGEDKILQEIRDYNEIDCISTQKLRDWLISEVRPDELPWKTPPEEFGSDAVEDADVDAENLHRALKDVEEKLDERLTALAFDLSYFHKREAKPGWWAVFDRMDKESDELIDDLECLAGLEAIGPAEQVKRSQERSYSFPTQETKLHEGVQATLKPGEMPRTVTVVELDSAANTAVVRFGPKLGAPPEQIDLLPNSPFKQDVMIDAVARVVGSLIDETHRYPAVESLLKRDLPKLSHAHNNRPIIRDNSEVVAQTVTAIADLDRSVLPIQGPPGTGKTYVSSKAILHLVGLGKRVAVSSNSHKAIENLLFAVLDRADEEGTRIKVAKKVREEIGEPYGPRIIQTESNDDPSLFDADVVGGTAWLFSRADFDQHFDYLFVDEAGQVSIANLVAMGTAARNIVLVGDPMQLPQPLQGVHPGESGFSSLEYMLMGHRTIPTERGVFLPVSRRMHPTVCRFISDIVYEGRLESDEGAAAQNLSGIADSLDCGVHLVEVPHEGNSQSSEEEVEAIVGAFNRLIGVMFQDRDGKKRALTLDDILVVAPYNAQVNALQAALPAGARVGTVDRFQGQEAPVCLVSMTTSSSEEMPRNVDFLFSLNRINVAVSRAQVLSLVFASPRLLEVPCRTVEQMRLVNTLCALKEYGNSVSAGGAF
jgi:predicted RecB family nuclease